MQQIQLLILFFCIFILVLGGGGVYWFFIRDDNSENNGNESSPSSNETSPSNIESSSNGIESSSNGIESSSNGIESSSSNTGSSSSTFQYHYIPLYVYNGQNLNKGHVFKDFHRPPDRAASLNDLLFQDDTTIGVNVNLAPTTYATTTSTTSGNAYQCHIGYPDHVGYKQEDTGRLSAPDARSWSDAMNTNTHDNELYACYIFSAELDKERMKRTGPEEGNMTDAEVDKIENIVVELNDGMKQLCLPVTQIDMPAEYTNQRRLGNDDYLDPSYGICPLYHHWLTGEPGELYNKSIHLVDDCNNGTAPGSCYGHSESNSFNGNYFVILTKDPITQTI